MKLQSPGGRECPLLPCLPEQLAQTVDALCAKNVAQLGAPGKPIQFWVGLLESTHERVAALAVNLTVLIPVPSVESIAHLSLLLG